MDSVKQAPKSRYSLNVDHEILWKIWFQRNVRPQNFAFLGEGKPGFIPKAGIILLLCAGCGAGFFPTSFLKNEEETKI